MKAKPISNTAPQMGESAAVGLAGFDLTTLILQLHNIGLCGLGPVVACGVIFCGLAQLIAELQEVKAESNSIRIEKHST